MTGFVSEFRGLAIIENDIETRRKSIRDRLAAALLDIASDGGDRMRQAMLSSASPSAPGSAPAVVTGHLIGSIRAEQKHGEVGARIRVGSNGKRGKAPHWHLLEFGTSKMAPRPFIRDNARAAAEDGSRRIAEALRGA